MGRSGVVFRYGSLYRAEVDRGAQSGMRLARIMRPMAPTRSMTVHARGLEDLIAAGVHGDGEAGAVRVDVGSGVGGVRHDGAQQLVSDQQSVDLGTTPAGVRARSTRPPRIVDVICR